MGGVRHLLKKSRGQELGTDLDFVMDSVGEGSDGRQAVLIILQREVSFRNTKQQTGTR
jgi:hypothetical protein